MQRRFTILSLSLLLSALPGCLKTPAAAETELSPGSENSQQNQTQTRAPAPCGMPEGIAEPDWPRTLHPTSTDETAPFVPGSVTLSILPDTQYYAYCRSNHARKQIEWVERERKARNIQAVLQLGDLTESNTPEEWSFIRDAFRALSPSVPLLLTTGNHDYGEGGTANRRHTLFSHYFHEETARPAGALVRTKEPGDIENAFYSLELPHLRLGVLLLEWSPRLSTVEWAHQVLTDHPDHRVVFITHAYLYYDGTRYDYATHGDAQKWNPLAYGTAQGPDAGTPHDGEMLWNALIRKHPQIFLTLNGHVLGDGAGVLTSQGDAGNTVHQMLVNYQMLDEGGLGYLRLLELLPDGRTLRFKTYSPSLDLFATAADQDFSLTVEPPLWQPTSPAR